MDPLETPLHKAVKAGNIQDVKALILKEGEIKSKDNLNRTQLHHAVFENIGPKLHIPKGFGFIEIIKMPTAKDANIDAKDSSGFTPLHRAAMKGYDLVLEVLLQNGANIEAQTNSGRTPLHLAAGSTSGHVKTLEILAWGRASPGPPLAVYRYKV